MSKKRHENDAPRRPSMAKGESPLKINPLNHPKVAEGRGGTWKRVALSLGALGAIGGAVGMSKAGDKPSAPSHAPEKPGSAEVPTTQETESLRSFTVGEYKLSFDPKFSDEEFNRIKNILERSYPELIKYIPVPKDIGKSINVSRKTDGPSVSDWRENLLMINPSASDGIIIHEFVHLLHGSRDTQVDFIEEGLATGISELVTKSIGAEPASSKIVQLQMNQTLKDGGLALMSNVSFYQYHPLHPVRLNFAGQFWLALEKSHPGLIKEFHEEYYKFLDGGGKNNDSKALADIIKAIDKSQFEHELSTNPVLRFNPALTDKNLLYIFDYQMKTGEKILKICLVRKDKNGAERGVRGQEVPFKFVNLDTGKVSRQLAAKTGNFGEIDLNFSPGHNIDLDKEVGPGKNFKIIVDVVVEEGGHPEEYPFSIVK